MAFKNKALGSPRVLIKTLYFLIIAPNHTFKNNITQFGQIHLSYVNNVTKIGSMLAHSKKGPQFVYFVRTFRHYAGHL